MIIQRSSAFNHHHSADMHTFGLQPSAGKEVPCMRINVHLCGKERDLRSVTARGHKCSWYKREVIPFLSLSRWKRGQLSASRRRGKASAVPPDYVDQTAYQQNQTKHLLCSPQGPNKEQTKPSLSQCDCEAL